MIDEFKTPIYLAIDPGETCGWATFDHEGSLVDMGQFPYNELVKQLKTLCPPSVTVIIVEDYRNHGWMQQKRWSRNNTSKTIGKIETFAELGELKVVLQPNTVKSIGYMYAGKEPPSNHSISHQFDAYAHGVFYLQTEGIRPVGKALLQARKAQNEDH